MYSTFNIGGIHPEENKITQSAAVRNSSLPNRVFIPLGQALGAPSSPVVGKGDVVKAGQLIARGDAFISAHVHSSVSGKVVKIDEVVDTSGYRRKVVVIDVEGDEWLPEINLDMEPLTDINDWGREQVVDKVREAGIVGLGGATFPSHVKLMVPTGKHVEILIINGAECEPYLTADHRLMLEKSLEVVTGVRLLMRGLGVEKAFIGIENNKTDAIEKLTEAALEYPGIQIRKLKTKYPQGGEKQLIKALTRKDVPSGKLPLEVGVVVNNVGTAFAVYEAIMKNKPLVERIVTVTGKSVTEPGNFITRVGTPVSHLIDQVGGLPEDTGKVISGGPMMGKALSNLDVPVVKGTSGILILSRDESRRPKAQTCIRCSKCVSVCPMGLEPYYLAQVSKLALYDQAEQHAVMDCIECGSCMFTCPSYRPLLDYIRLGKVQVGRIIRSRKN